MQLSLLANKKSRTEDPRHGVLPPPSNGPDQSHLARIRADLIHDSNHEFVDTSVAQGPPVTKGKGVVYIRLPPPHLLNPFASFPSLPPLSLVFLGQCPATFSPSNLQSCFSLHPFIVFPLQCSAFPRSCCLPSLFPVHRLHPSTQSVSLKSSPIPPRSGKLLACV